MESTPMYNDPLIWFREFISSDRLSDLSDYDFEGMMPEEGTYVNLNIDREKGVLTYESIIMTDHLGNTPVLQICDLTFNLRNNVIAEAKEAKRILYGIVDRMPTAGKTEYLNKKIISLNQLIKEVRRKDLRGKYGFVHTSLEDIKSAAKSLLPPKDSQLKQETYVCPKFTTDTEAVRSFYDSLVNSKMIALCPAKAGSTIKNELYNDLVAIFTGGKLRAPICWTGDINELCYLLKQLYKLGIIREHPKLKWQIATNCFLTSDGGRFIINNLKGAHKPSSASIIDKIIAHLQD